MQATELFKEFNIDLEIQQCQFSWFDTKGDKDFLPENFPIFIVNHDKEYCFYGFPDAGNGF